MICFGGNSRFQPSKPSSTKSGSFLSSGMALAFLPVNEFQTASRKRIPRPRPFVYSIPNSLTPNSEHQNQGESEQRKPMMLTQFDGTPPYPL